MTKYGDISLEERELLDALADDWDDCAGCDEPDCFQCPCEFFSPGDTYEI